MSTIPEPPTTPGWEYQLFATSLSKALAQHDRDYFEYLRGDVAADGPVVDDPRRDAPDRLNTPTAIVDRLNTVLTSANVTAAFGPQGQSGDANAIGTLVQGLDDIFAQLLSWGITTRSVKTDPAWTEVYVAMANLVRQPLAQISAFAKDFATRTDQILADVAAGRAPTTNLNLTLKITMGDVEERALNDAMSRLMPEKPHRFFHR